VADAKRSAARAVVTWAVSVMLALLLIGWRCGFG
jgi:hypothetical protein